MEMIEKEMAKFENPPMARKSSCVYPNRVRSWEPVPDIGTSIHVPSGTPAKSVRPLHRLMERFHLPRGPGWNIAFIRIAERRADRCELPGAREAILRIGRRYS